MAKLAGVTFTGLDTFKQELQVLTSDLTEEANAIMLSAAFDAADHIRSAYPYDLGALRRGVIVVPSQGTLIAGGEVKNLAPHAWIYEHGTKPRANRAGANRGQMSATPTFEPIAESYRGSAVSAVIFRLYQHGAIRVVTDEHEAA